ncbi:UNVERIFIED_CONTAM: hypothetical protein GTU68_034312 [Idotea baltica]|nr:hypothetical protein [Idotea baltica]
MTVGSLLTNLSSTWFGHLVIILLGYGTIFVPGYFLIRYFKNSSFIDRAGSGFVSRLIVSCVYGNAYDKIVDESSPATPPKQPSRKDKSVFADASKLVFCFVGLQVSYLTWGVLQEKIMTKEYVGFSGSKGKFKDSQFLVFVNRILAFLLSGAYLLCTRQPRHTAPLYQYSYCSFSNIMSSWCQYEALKYVSFPTQVLAKASKIIPTMIMGKIISARKYEYYEYVTAVLISLGMTLFLMTSSENHGSGAASTTLSGVIILMGYMSFDSFTSNWQGELFSQYKMSSVQMMCGVNLFSCLFTSVSLLQQGVFLQSLRFMFLFPTFFWDCIILSVCSATGQLFIYYTISSFGPIVFVIIMTIRQGLAILLSCILYMHPITLWGLMGIMIVFGAIFLRIYCNYRLKQLKSRRSGLSESSKV